MNGIKSYSNDIPKHVPDMRSTISANSKNNVEIEITIISEILRLGVFGAFGVLDWVFP